MVRLEYEGKSMPATAGRVNSIMKEGRTARRLLSEGGSAEKAQERSARLRSIKEARDEREYSQQKRKILRELGLLPDGRAWGRIFHVKVDKAPERNRRMGERKINPTQPRLGIRNYKAAIRDDRGRIAVFVRMRYLGQKSKGYRSGLAADHVKYIFREDGLENPEIQLEAPMSNVGNTVEECAAFWNALEPIEEGYRANSKIQFRMTVALPHFFDAEQRRRVTQQTGDQVFGRVGLGWMAANHLPDAKGSQRNFHPHFAASMRPAERICDHGWAFTEEKLTEPFTPEGLLRMRATIAAIINIECRNAGFDERYTHQSYRRRGIDAVATEHIGPDRMALHDKGDAVGVVERNNARVKVNELSVKAQHLSRKLAIQKRLVALTNEAAALARNSAKLQVLKSAVMQARDSAFRIPAMQSATETRSVFAPISKRVNSIRTGAIKLRSIKPAKSSTSSTRITLKSVAAAARKVSQADALTPAQLNQNFRKDILALVASLRHGWPAQPAGESTAASEAAGLIAQRARSLRNIKNNISAKTVTRDIKRALRSIDQSAALLRLSVKRLSVTDGVQAQIGAIRKQATARLQSRKSKTIVDATGFQLMNIIKSSTSIGKRPAVQSITSSSRAALAGIARTASGVSRQTTPKKIEREFSSELVAIIRDAESLRTSPDSSHWRYADELEVLHKIRKAALARPVTKPAGPASPGIDLNQHVSDAHRNILGVTAIPATTQREQQPVAVQVHEQTKDAPSPRGTPIPINEIGDARQTLEFIKAIPNNPVSIYKDKEGILFPAGQAVSGISIDKDVLQTAEIQATLREASRAQNAEKDEIFALLLKHADSGNIEDEEALAAVLPEEKQGLIGRWKDTTSWLALQCGLRDQQERRSEGLYRKWVKAKSVGETSRFVIADEALRQFRNWPVDFPEAGLESLKSDAERHRLSMLARQQQIQNSIGR
ncbi:MAG: MobA/MobL family protein [Parasphingorhabdus sp.]